MTGFKNLWKNLSKKQMDEKEGKGTFLPDGFHWGGKKVYDPANETTEYAIDNGIYKAIT